MKKSLCFLIALSLILAMPLCSNAEVTKQFAEEGAASGEMTRIGEDFESYEVGTEVASGTNNGMYSSVAFKYAGDAATNKYLLIDQAIKDSADEGLFLAPNANDKVTLSVGSKYIYNLDFMVTDLNSKNWGIASSGVKFRTTLVFDPDNWAANTKSTGWEFNCFGATGAPLGVINGSATDFGIDKFAVNKWNNLKLVLEPAAGSADGKVDLTATAYVNGTLVSSTNSTTTLEDVDNEIYGIGLGNITTVSQSYGYTLALDNLYLSVYDEDLMESYKAVKKYDASGNLTYIGDDFEKHTPGVFGVTNTNLLGQGDYYLTGTAEVAKDEDGNKYLITKHKGDSDLILIKPDAKSFALEKGKKYIYNLDFRAEPTSWYFTQTGSAIRPMVGYNKEWVLPTIWQIDYNGAKFAAETAASATTATLSNSTQYDTGDKLKEILYTGDNWNNLQVIVEVDDGTAEGAYKLTTKMLVNGIMMGTSDMTAPAEVVITDSEGLYSFGVVVRQTDATERIIHLDNFYLTEYSDNLVTKAKTNLTFNNASVVNEDGTASVSFKPVTQSETETATVILAAYDKDGTMIDAKLEQNIEIDKYNFETLKKASLTLPDATKIVKGFIWESVSNLVPLTMIEAIEIQ